MQYHTFICSSSCILSVQVWKIISRGTRRAWSGFLILLGLFQTFLESQQLELQKYVIIWLIICGKSLEMVALEILNWADFPNNHNWFLNHFCNHYKIKDFIIYFRRSVSWSLLNTSQPGEKEEINCWWNSLNWRNEASP